jgi:DNA-binding response OmpR family regulator
LSDVLLLTDAAEKPAGILPSLSLLAHSVRLAPAEAAALAGSQSADVVLIDSRRDLMHAKSLLRLLRGAGLELPVLVVVAEGGWAAVTADWGADDVILHTAGPGEVDARLRLAIGRRSAAGPAEAGEIRSGDLVIDEASYSVRLRGRVLDLTFKEFELLKFLAQQPARVFTRSQLLQEVWGYDYFGGTRTVDVHVRRLRAKLGAEYEVLIGTVRNVGYRFVPVPGKAEDRGKPGGAADQPADGDEQRAMGAGRAGGVHDSGPPARDRQASAADGKRREASPLHARR